MTLEARNITFSYEKDKKLIENMNFTIEQGEIVGLFAPSGGGKTTLCKLLGGYIKPNVGEIYVDNKPLKAYKGYCIVQLIWQQPYEAVNERLRAKEILNEADDIWENAVSELEIKKDWLERFPRELSGGELQRFCIARALTESTKFILADEITAMYDMINQKKIWDYLLKEVKKRNIGMLIVSHNKHMLEKICTKVVELEKII